MPIARINGKILHFVHIPKTGGSTITSYLRSIGQVALYSRERIDCLRSTPQHMDIRTSKTLLPQGFVDARFAILRNPVARMHSEFRYRYTRLARNGEGACRKDPNGAVQVELDWGESFFGTFDEWVGLVIDKYNQEACACDNHIRPQSDFIDEDVRVFLFEDGLESVIDWINKFTETSTSPFIPDTNASVEIPISMSSKTKRIIREFYADDYSLILRHKATNSLKEVISCR